MGADRKILMKRQRDAHESNGHCRLLEGRKGLFDHYRLSHHLIKQCWKSMQCYSCFFCIQRMLATPKSLMSLTWKMEQTSERIELRRNAFLHSFLFFAIGSKSKMKGRCGKKVYSHLRLWIGNTRVCSHQNIKKISLSTYMRTLAI